jgi:hypothetical protein
VFSPHIPATSPLHQVGDQSRLQQYRNPVVEIIISSYKLKNQISNLKDKLLTNPIDVLYSNDLVMSLNDVKDYYAKGNSDFIVYIDVSGFLLLPKGINVSLSSITNIIIDEWNFKNNNLTLEQLELLTSAEMEEKIMKLAPNVFENIEETIQNLQNETNDAIVSSTMDNCKFNTKALTDLRTNLENFFGKLNLANSIIADLPIYTKYEPDVGHQIKVCPPSPNGLSSSAQKVFSYLLGKSLSQIHMCLYHINKLLGEFKANSSAFIAPSITSAGLNPTPLCAPVCSTICGEEPTSKIEYGKKLEPEVAVDTPAQYSLSFRKKFDTGVSPFGPSYY